MFIRSTSNAMKKILIRGLLENPELFAESLDAVSGHNVEAALTLIEE